MPLRDLSKIPSWNSRLDALNVIIETSKRSRNKFAYERETALFRLKKVLPSGMEFPYDFGFVPSTLGEDGDPVDVLVLMDEPAFTGCHIECRLIGVIEGAAKVEGKTQRNDRLVAVAHCSHDHGALQSIKDIDAHLLKELEHFFVTYHDLDGTQFKILGCRGPRGAKKLVEQGNRRFRRKARRK